MNYIDIPFPECLSFGASFDPEWFTTVVPTISGHESTNENWEDAKHTGDVSFAIRKAIDYRLVRTHFHEVRGRANSFPFKDFLDYQVLVTEGVLLSDLGASPSGNGTFNLHKKYGSVNAYNRRITRPDTPIQVFRNAVDITGAGAAVTYAGGTVAITGHTGGDVYTWSGTFKVPSRYDLDRLPSVAMNKSGPTLDDLLVDCGSIPVVEVRET